MFQNLAGNFLAVEQRKKKKKKRTGKDKIFQSH